MKISTMPVKINDAFYDAKIPIYFSGGGQESFISYHELAKSLGIDCGVKTPGLFQTEYYLGDDLFKVNRLTPGEHFYIKDQEVFISLTYLKQGTPFPDIHVYNDTLLADGSNREIIYIDNYARRFDYSWTQNVYIAHAFGGIDEVSYTNSLEAFQKNYQAGHRVFEVDLQLTKDQSLVAVHDQPLTKDGKLMRTKEFQKQKIKGKYTALSITDIMRLMDKYPDFYLVTDSKETQGPNMEKQFQILVQTAESINPEVLTRVIPQIYNEEMLSAIMDIYEWKSVIYTLYALSDFSEQEVIDFAYREGIQVITTLPGKSQGMFFRELFERGIQVYMHTYNTLDEFAALQQMGVHGIYTDFLTPAIDDRHS